MIIARQHRGSTAIELPLMLWFLMVLILFPLLNLGSCCVRSYYFFQATHNAALQAAKARSFQVSGTPLDPSSMVVATNVANGIAGQWPGVNITTVTTFIVQTDINNGTETTFTARLAVPANTVSNLYQIRVRCQGSVEPLIPFNLGFFGAIPGLTGNIPLDMNDQNAVENTQGLTR